MTYSTGDLFPFEPDWSDGVIERMEWMTDIMRANNGDEQRVGVRDQPRVSLSVRYLLQRNDAAFLRNLAWRRSFYYFYLPFWPHRWLPALGFRLSGCSERFPWPWWFRPRSGHGRGRGSTGSAGGAF